MGQQQSKSEPVVIQENINTQPKTQKKLASRKNEARPLLKKCFQNHLFSLVPFEIWRDILCFTDVETSLTLSQTCWGFRAIFETTEDEEKNFRIALFLRRKGDIKHALQYLKKCTDKGNPIAMFHVGFSLIFSGGWGLEREYYIGAQWMKKSAEAGYALGMIYYANCLNNGDGVDKNHELSSIWGKKAFLTNDPHVLGECYRQGLVTESDQEKSFEWFKKSAEQGNEFGQYRLGDYYSIKRNKKEAFEWYLKSAEQGLCISQANVAVYYAEGLGCEKDIELAKIWYKKAANQGHYQSRASLAGLDVYTIIVKRDKKN